MAKSVTTDPIKLSNVRLSFARLFTPKAFQQGQDPRFEGTFLLDPASTEGKAQIRVVLKAAADAAKQVFGKIPYEVYKMSNTYLGTAIPPDAKADGITLCFVNGSDKPYDGYEGKFVIPTHNKVRPTVVNRNRVPVQEHDAGAPYSGCYVNTSITLWVQDNQYGKRVNANLRAVQFVQDGPAFGIQPVNAEDEFEALEDAVGGGTDDGFLD